VALWNLYQLARAIVPLVKEPEALRESLDQYTNTLAETQHAMMMRKLGLSELNPEEDRALFEALPEALAESQVDMTLFFRRLSHAVPALFADSEKQEAQFRAVLEAASYGVSPEGEQLLMQWLQKYAQRLQQEPAEPEAIRESMLSANPKYVLRNYLAQQAIEAAATGDLSVLNRLMEVLKTPFAEQPEHDDLAAKRPDWARTKPGCATLSCSS
jgi:uncharacterized protein YdiU (UPF0061 family)